MPAQAMGPTYAGGSQPIIKDGYSILYLPDVNNPALIAAGEAPVYYYVPNQVRMARKEGPDKGDFLFNMLRFAGTGGDGVIGGDGDVAGGVLTFSVTGDLPAKTREQAERQITEHVMGSTEAFWGAAGSRKPPMFRPAIITSSTTSVSNVSPTPRGFPTVGPATRGGGAGEISFTGVPALPGRRTRDGEQPGVPVAPETPAGGNDLDPWFWMMQGQGQGSIDPSGTHAFSGLLGTYPASICWAGFQGTASPLIVMQNYKLKVWSPVVKLTITGDWKNIHEHLSVAAKAKYLFASVDVKAEFNKMRKEGTIKVETLVDTTLPGADAIAERLQERTDLVFSKFMEQAQKTIFDPPPAQMESAQANTGNTPWGVAVALRYRVDETQLKLHYEETSQFAYLQDHTISSSLGGMFDEMRADPEGERKYFQTIYLDDWPRRLARLVRPVVAWGDKSVEFVSVQVGYPNTQGALNWEGHSFAGEEGNDGTWKFQTAQKAASDVTNPPADWTPDMTFVKRKVHLAEPPSDIEDPYRRVQIERNVIELDPGPNGSMLNDTTLELRADSAGRLSVGPIQLGVVLQDNTQVVEAVFEATDAGGEPVGMQPVRFRWNYNDVDVDRTWAIFTGDPAFMPYYRYKVSVTVKGTLFEPGRAWSGPWVRTNGNGPLIVDIPRPDQEGVVTRSVTEERVRGLLQLTRSAATEPDSSESYPSESYSSDSESSESYESAEEVYAAPQSASAAYEEEARPRGSGDSTVVHFRGYQV